ncbi:MAG: hypothetical protein KJ056_09565 [Acidimicrobiia bacterium]|nr:hypothetical protein [Acidimicrobiia bacterium]
MAFHDDTFDRLLASRSREVFAQTADIGLDGLLASVLTIVGTIEGDDATFAGRCASAYNKAIRAVSDDLRMSGSDLVDAVAGRRDPQVTAEFLALLGVENPPGRADQDAAARLTLDQWRAMRMEERMLDETAPLEVLESLQRFQTFIAIPAAWRELPAVICTRISVGWNDTCTATDASDGNLVVIQGFIPSRGSVEVVLAQRNSLRDDPRKSVIASLGSLNSSEIRAAPQISAVVQSTAATLDAIAEGGARLKLVG